MKHFYFDNKANTSLNIFVILMTCFMLYMSINMVFVVEPIIITKPISVSTSNISDMQNIVSTMFDEIPFWKTIIPLLPLVILGFILLIVLFSIIGMGGTSRYDDDTPPPTQRQKPGTPITNAPIQTTPTKSDEFTLDKPLNNNKKEPFKINKYEPTFPFD